MQYRTTAFLCLVVTMLLATSIYATEKYAEKTGRACEFCHLNPAGGGELTKTGTGYLLAMALGCKHLNRGGTIKSLN